MVPLNCESGSRVTLYMPCNHMESCRPHICTVTGVGNSCSTALTVCISVEHDPDRGKDKHVHQNIWSNLPGVNDSKRNASGQKETQV